MLAPSKGLSVRDKVKVLFSLSWLSALSGTAFGIVLPSLQRYVVASPSNTIPGLGSSNRVFTIIVALYSFGEFIGALLFGYLANRARSRTLVLCALPLFFLANVLYAVAPSVTYIVLSRSLVGVLSGGTVVVARAFVPRVTSVGERMLAFALLMGSSAASMAVAPALGLLFTHFSFQAHVFPPPPPSSRLPAGAHPHPLSRSLPLPLLPLRADEFRSPAWFLCLASLLSFPLVLATFKEPVEGWVVPPSALRGGGGGRGGLFAAPASGASDGGHSAAEDSGEGYGGSGGGGSGLGARLLPPQRRTRQPLEGWYADNGSGGAESGKDSSGSGGEHSGGGRGADSGSGREVRGGPWPPPADLGDEHGFLPYDPLPTATSADTSTRNLAGGVGPTAAVARGDAAATIAAASAAASVQATPQEGSGEPLAASGAPSGAGNGGDSSGGSRSGGDGSGGGDGSSGGDGSGGDGSGGDGSGLSSADRSMGSTPSGAFVSATQSYSGSGGNSSGGSSGRLYESAHSRGSGGSSDAPPLASSGDSNGSAGSSSNGSAGSSNLSAGSSDGSAGSSDNAISSDNGGSSGSAVAFAAPPPGGEYAYNVFDSVGSHSHDREGDGSGNNFSSSGGGGRGARGEHGDGSAYDDSLESNHTSEWYHYGWPDRSPEGGYSPLFPSPMAIPAGTVAGPPILECGVMMWLYFLLTLAFSMLETVATPVAGDTLGWNVSQTSLLYTFGGGLCCVSLLFLPLLQRYCGDTGVVKLGLLCVVLCALSLADVQSFVGPRDPCALFSCEAVAPGAPVIRANLSSVPGFSCPLGRGPAECESASHALGCAWNQHGSCPSCPPFCRNPARTLSSAQFMAAFGLFNAAFALGRTAVVSVYTRLLGDARQGTMMGLLSATGSASRVLGPLVAMASYTAVAPHTWLLSLLLLLLFLPTLCLLAALSRRVNRLIRVVRPRGARNSP